jgi:hypothetical protein
MLPVARGVPTLALESAIKMVIVSDAVAQGLLIVNYFEIYVLLTKGKLG